MTLMEKVKYKNLVRFVTNPPESCLIRETTQHVATGGRCGKGSLQPEPASPTTGLADWELASPLI